MPGRYYNSIKRAWLLMALIQQLCACKNKTEGIRISGRRQNKKNQEKQLKKRHKNTAKLNCLDGQLSGSMCVCVYPSHNGHKFTKGRHCPTGLFWNSSTQFKEDPIQTMTTWTATTSSILLVKNMKSQHWNKPVTPRNLMIHLCFYASALARAGGVVFPRWLSVRSLIPF